MFNLPTDNLGYGLGLRTPHYEQILRELPPVGWFEILSENYIGAHQGYWDYLLDLRRHYPIVMHGVSLSIGSSDPLDTLYLKKLKALADCLNVAWVSDHLCFTGVQQLNSHDLLPIPYTKEALEHLIPRIDAVQQYLGRPLILENASSYLEFKDSTIPESLFMAELCERIGCGILLDINNVYVSSFNHGWDAHDYIRDIPQEFIVQYHLAGHTHKGTHIIDTHNDYVTDDVWDLYAYTIQTKGFKSTMIEWDDAIPELSVLITEIDCARTIVEAQHRKAA